MPFHSQARLTATLACGPVLLFGAAWGSLTLRSPSGSAGNTSTGAAFERRLDPNGAGMMYQNFCTGGHVEPTLFVLGAQKASTTTFSSMVDWSPSIVRDRGTKHSTAYPKGQRYFAFSRGNNYAQLRFPECDTSVRQIGLDVKPRYLRDPEIPQRMASYYGARKTELQFAILLREPAARMHSAFHHLYYNAAHDFTKFVRPFIEGGPQKPDLQEAALGSLYAPQLERWFGTFDSRQFFILPYRLGVNTPGQNQTAVERMWERLHVEGTTHDVPRLNSRTERHLPVDQELDAQRLQALRGVLAEKGGDAAWVARVLAASDAELFGYGGAKGDVNQVAAWLVEHW